MKIEIFEMTQEHVPGVVNVENNSFTIPWSEKSFKDELNNSLAKYFVAVIEKTVIGYIGMWEISGQCDITNAAVLPEYRRHGIGRLLIEHIVQHCKDNSLSPITLEVRQSNAAAIMLYKSAGFLPVGNRKKYYADTGEDAIIMSKTIQTER